jgi:hypothetical protein
MRHVARMREMIISCKMLSENLNGRDNSDDLGADGKIILE